MDSPAKALRQAINEQDYFKAKTLLDRGVDPDLGNLRGNTALHRAVIVGDASLVDLVLRYRPTLSIRNEDNHTAASLAEYLGRKDLLARITPSQRRPST